MKSYDSSSNRNGNTFFNDDFFDIAYYLYLCVEEKDLTEHRHKLETIEKGPYNIFKALVKTLVIENVDLSI